MWIKAGNINFGACLPSCLVPTVEIQSSAFFYLARFPSVLPMPGMSVQEDESWCGYPGAKCVWYISEVGFRQQLIIPAQDLDRMAALTLRLCKNKELH